MVKKCVIITGGNGDFIPPITNGEFIIACDKGLEYAQRANIAPSLVIGDFDSYTGKLPTNLKTIVFPCEKDDTDTYGAVKYALNNGFEEIRIFGALGGRLDHMYANFQTAAFVAKNNAMCIIEDKTTKLFSFKNRSIVIDKVSDCSLSVFSHTEVSKGVTLKGLKYPLDNVTISNTFPIGVSNEFVEDTATITVKNGILFVMVCKL